jgi:monoamine oxidase
MSQIGDFMVVAPCGGPLAGRSLLVLIVHVCPDASPSRPCMPSGPDLSAAMKSGHSTSQNMQGQPADLRLALWRYGRNAACQIKENIREPAFMSAMPSAVAKPTEAYDVVVVGAGFAGMYMLHRVRGQGMTARVYEQGSGVGGTWYWNRYPGARCDVESMQYSYSFSEALQREWQWSERYASQPELLSYARHVADRFDLRPDIEFNTRVASAVFDENAWTVTLDDGRSVRAHYVVMATGCLSNARTPDFEGLASFTGKTYHTGHWPHRFHRRACRRHRHGLVGDPGHSGDRRTGETRHGVPADAELQHSGAQPPAHRAGAGVVDGELSGRAAPRARGNAQRDRVRDPRQGRA